MTLPRNKQQPPRKPKGPNGVAGLLKGMISPSGGDDSIGLIDLAAVAIISILATYFATNYFGAKTPAVPVSFYIISGSNFSGAATPVTSRQLSGLYPWGAL